MMAISGMVVMAMVMPMAMAMGGRYAQSDGDGDGDGDGDDDDDGNNDIDTLFQDLLHIIISSQARTFTDGWRQVWHCKRGMV